MGKSLDKERQIIKDNTMLFSTVDIMFNKITTKEQYKEIYEQSGSASHDNGLVLFHMGDYPFILLKGRLYKIDQNVTNEIFSFKI